MIVAQIVLLAAMSAGVAAGSPLTNWAQRVLQDPEQPHWKQCQAAQAVADGAAEISMRTTRYSDDDRLDPITGGGPDGCSWRNPGGASRPSVRLAWGHIAADLLHWPTGSVFYAEPPYDRSWIVTDCGPGVRGRNRVDIYCPGVAEWRHYGAWTREARTTRIRIHYLGRITRAQALGAN